MEKAEAIYVAVAAKQDEHRIEYGFRLIRDAFRYLAHLQLNFRIRNLYAILMEPGGQQLADALHFDVLWERTPPAGMHFYRCAVLDLADPDNPNILVRTLRPLLTGSDPAVGRGRGGRGARPGRGRAGPGRAS